MSPNLVNKKVANLIKIQKKLSNNKKETAKKEEPKKDIKEMNDFFKEYNFEESKKEYIKPLVFTARVIRTLVLFIIIEALLMYVLVGKLINSA